MREIILLWALGISFALNCFWYLWILPRSIKRYNRIERKQNELGGKVGYYKTLSDKAYELSGAMQKEFQKYVTASQAREIQSFQEKEALKKEIAKLKSGKR